MCSESAIVIVMCSSSVICHSLCVVNSVACVHSRGHIFSLIIMKLGQNVCLDEIWDEFEMGHVGSKTRSLGQILEKPCIHSRGHIFSPIIMKLCQNVCLDKISDKFENVSCWVKNLVTRSNLRKILEKPCVHSKGHISVRLS